MTHCGFQDEAMQALSAKDVPEIHNILEVPYTRQRPLALAFTSAVQFRYPSVIFLSFLLSIFPLFFKILTISPSCSVFSKHNHMQSQRECKSVRK